MPIIDPRSDPRLVEIPHPSLPVPPPGPAPLTPQGPVPPLQGPLPPVQPSADTGFLGQIMAIMQAPRNALYSQYPGGYEGFKGTMTQNIDRAARYGGAVNLPMVGPVWGAASGLGGDIGKDLVLDQVFDPVSQVLMRGNIGGVGNAIEKGMLALPGAGAKTAATADQVVRALNLGDKLLNDAAELPFKAAIKGTKAAVAGATINGVKIPGLASIPGTGFGMKALEDDGTARTATSLYDWATSKSPQTALRMIAAQLHDINAHLRSQGQSLEMGLSDWQGRSGRITWPGNLTDATQQLDDLGNALKARIIQAHGTNPHTGQIGHTIVHQVDAFRDTLNGRFRALRAEQTRLGTPAAQRAQEQQQLVQESWQKMADLTSGARDVFEELASDLHGPQIPGAAPSAEQMAAVSRKLQQRMEQLKFLHHDLPGFMADLPNQFRSQSGGWYDSLLDKSMTDYASGFAALSKHLGNFEQGLKYVWGRANPGQAFPGIAAKTAEDRLSQINGILGQMGMDPVEGAGGLYQRLAPHLPVTDANMLKKHLETWGEDFLSKDLFDTVTQRVVREHADRLGVKPLTGPAKWGADQLQFWKTLTLSAPSYLLNNLYGGLFMGGLRGVSPGKVMQGLAENVGTSLRGGKVEISPLTSMNKLLDTVTPHEVTSGSGTQFLSLRDDVMEMLGQAPNIMDRIGAPVLAGGGALAGGYSGLTDTPVDHPEDRTKNMLMGAGVGALKGGSMPIAAKYLLTHLGGGLEAVMRQTAHLKALTGGIESRAGDLQAIAQQALLAPQGGKALASTAHVAPALADLETRGGFISAGGLEDFLHMHGVDPDTARQAGGLWRDKVAEATREGTTFSHGIHFNYEDLTNVEQVAKQFLPFATWGLKAYPFFMEELVKHPQVSLPLIRMTLDQQQEAERKGLPDRFAGSVHAPALDQFWSAITGKPQQVYLNPIRGLTPFSDLASLEGINENQTPPEQALKVMSALGFGLRPDVEAALGMTPAISGSAPAKGYFRDARAIQGLTGQLGMVNGRGVDLDAPIKDVQARLRMAFRGLEPTDAQEAAVLKKLDERALRETGHPISSGHISVLPYLEARHDRRGAVWDLAQGEASRESAGRSMLGMLTQIGAPQALLGAEEEKIRADQARRTVSPDVTRELKRELQAGHSATVRPDLVPELQRSAQDIRARYGRADLPQEVHQILMQPTVANLEKLRGWISEEEQALNPLTLGYSGGGSPEEVRLTSALSAYYSLPFLLRQDPAYKNLPPDKMAELERTYSLGSAAGAKKDNPVFGPIMQYTQQRRDQMLAEDPVLAAYLRWQQQQRGYGNPRQFMQEVWGDPARRAAVSTPAPILPVPVGRPPTP